MSDKSHKEEAEGINGSSHDEGILSSQLDENEYLPDSWTGTLPLISKDLTAPQPAAPRKSTSRTRKRDRDELYRDEEEEVLETPKKLPPAKRAKRWFSFLSFAPFFLFLGVD